MTTITAMGCAIAPPVRSRRPFLLTSFGVLVDGLLDDTCPSVSALTHEQRAQAADVLNDRFQSIVVAAEQLCGPVDETRYVRLRQSFVERIIKMTPPAEWRAADEPE